MNRRYGHLKNNNYGWIFYAPTLQDINNPIPHKYKLEDGVLTVRATIKLPRFRRKHAHMRPIKEILKAKTIPLKIRGER